MKKRNDIGGARRLTIPLSNPCPTVMAGGVGSVNCSQYTLGVDMPKLCDNVDQKPPYKVPSMAEIAAIPWNGLTVVSTFSGCGGSCLGYRMAGYKVLWANEFVPAAQDSYRANMSKDSILDCRDIHDVIAEKILEATGLAKGELDLFDGSPPCQAFSTAGKRHKGWGKKKKYSHGAEQCNETLFDEWLRLLEGLMPKTFVAENVSGMVKGTVKGMFLEILAKMKSIGYRVSCKVLDAQWLGVPQQRQRCIFIGVREDLKDAKGNLLMPAHPKPLPYRYSVREAIPWITGNIDQGKVFDESNRSTSSDTPCPTVKAQGIGAQLKGKVFIEPESGWQDAQDSCARRITETDICPTILAQGRGYNGIIIEMKDIRRDEETGASLELDSSRKLACEGLQPFQTCRPVDPSKSSGTITTQSINTPLLTERRKFSIAELRRICAFPDDFILTGTYAQQWERLGNSVPPVMMYWIAKTIRDNILKKINR